MTPSPTRRIACALLCILLSAGASALERGEAVVVSAERSHRLQVEIARTAAERATGLMERDHLAADAGMLFVYAADQPPDNGFWMYRTRIALDIAFLGADGEIRAIRTMTPCRGEAPSCPSYSPGRPYRAALEVNAGYFARHAITVGDCVTLPGSVNGCRH